MTHSSVHLTLYVVNNEIHSIQSMIMREEVIEQFLDQEQIFFRTKVTAEFTTYELFFEQGQGQESLTLGLLMHSDTLSPYTLEQVHG